MVQNVQNPGENQRILLSTKRSDGLPKNIEKEKMNALRKVERATADRRIVRNAIFRSYQLWLDYFMFFVWLPATDNQMKSQRNFAVCWTYVCCTRSGGSAPKLDPQEPCK